MYVEHLQDDLKSRDLLKNVKKYHCHILIKNMYKRKINKSRLSKGVSSLTSWFLLPMHL